MSFETGKPDFTAILTYRTTEEGGRETPAFTGYRPQIKFEFSDMQTSGSQKFLNTDIVYPGQTVEAEITIVSPNICEGKLTEGTPFEFREGRTVIGTGVIKKILNPDLVKK